MASHDDFYFASLGGGLMLDAKAMGSVARFTPLLNHSQSSSHPSQPSISHNLNFLQYLPLLYDTLSYPTLPTLILPPPPPPQLATHHHLSDTNLFTHFLSLSLSPSLPYHHRFANHSCDPTCELQKWSVCGEPRIALVSKRALSEGSEVTYNYQYYEDGLDITTLQRQKV